MSDIDTEIEDLAQKRARLAHWCYMRPDDAAARIEALEAALRRVDAINDSPATFNRDIDDVCRAARDKDAGK